MIGLGVDIGGGSIKVGLFNEKGEILLENSEPTHSEMKNSDFEAAIRSSLHPILKSSWVKSTNGLEGVGIGSPGPIDNSMGIIYGSANLPGIDSFPIVDFFRSEYGLEAILNNDANSAAMGEYYFGQGRGSKNLFVFTLGTGLGGGWIQDGRLYNGWEGNGMEVGHTTIVHEGAICGCGQRGCAEAYFSAKGLLNRYRDRTSISLPSVAELFEQARSGDLESMNTILNGTDILAEASRNIVNLLNVDTIVFVGGLTRSWDLFGERLGEEIRKKSFSVLAKNLRILKGENKAILGSGALLLERMGVRAI